MNHPTPVTVEYLTAALDYTDAQLRRAQTEILRLRARLARPTIR